MSNLNPDKLLGGLYGAVLGDAVGVSYEFQKARDIPRVDLIDMDPVVGINSDYEYSLNFIFTKTYPRVKIGTWSDDTSLLLCLLDALLEGAGDWEYVFRSNILAWRYYGTYAVDNRVFDIGTQTQIAVEQLDNGQTIRQRAIDHKAYGNGALMRALPVALITSNDGTAAYYARYHTMATHNNDLCMVASTAYAWLAARLLRGMDLDAALDETLAELGILTKQAEAVEIFRGGEKLEATGSGYVVDTFWSAYYALKRGKNFREVIQHAIALGNDTDTTACVAGGLAGIIYGFDTLPTDWLTSLRQKDLIDEFADRLLAYHSRTSRPGDAVQDCDDHSEAASAPTGVSSS